MLVKKLRITQKVDREQWPFYLPPVRQIIKDELTFTKPITFIVGENGSGKSTVIEALAEAYGLDVRGGHGARIYGPASTAKSPLGATMQLDYTATGMTAKHNHSPGFFLRSETAKGVLEYMSENGVPGYGRNIATSSHGEGFIQAITGRFTGKGLYLLDEPEAALSFSSCLLLMEQLRKVAAAGSQVICATHSPIITALPEASIFEFNDDGVTEKPWAELQLVQHWQRFMGSPVSYLTDLE